MYQKYQREHNHNNDNGDTKERKPLIMGQVRELRVNTVFIIPVSMRYLKLYMLRYFITYAFLFCIVIIFTLSESIKTELPKPYTDLTSCILRRALAGKNAHLTVAMADW